MGRPEETPPLPSTTTSTTSMPSAVRRILPLTISASSSSSSASSAPASLSPWSESSFAEDAEPSSPSDVPPSSSPATTAPSPSSSSSSSTSGGFSSTRRLRISCPFLLRRTSGTRDMRFDVLRALSVSCCLAEVAAFAAVCAAFLPFMKKALAKLTVSFTSRFAMALCPPFRAPASACRAISSMYAWLKMAMKRFTMRSATNMTKKAKNGAATTDSIGAILSP
mmetsp:Transcript_27490/g.89956  ORF Transcript_27490/g.89956 Transcript_27490/m.89956 type:complete len:223 (+) Transcript_27490:574-1242(+)